MFYKIKRKVFKLLYLFKYYLIGFPDYKSKQLAKFKFNKLDYNKAIKKINDLKNIFEEIDYSMKSEHIILFLSLSQKKKVNRILEIGTFDGSNAYLMSKIFSSANIRTIDLPDKDTNFRKLYGRSNDNKLVLYLKKRKETILKNSKIKFDQMNSSFLVLEKETNQFDLIWIDGYHGSPIVIFDVINAIRLIKKDGVIMCDDVFLKSKNSNDPYHSDAAYRTLEELKKIGIINYELFYKRLDKKHNFFPEDQKFIAYITLK